MKRDLLVGMGLGLAFMLTVVGYAVWRGGDGGNSLDWNRYVGCDSRSCRNPHLLRYSGNSRSGL